MAIVDLGTITVDNTIRVANPFPTVSLTGGVGYIHLLDLQPTTQVPNFVYYVVAPFILFGGSVFEIQEPFKWYPRGVGISFVVPVYDIGGASLDIGISVIPIQIFPGRASPQKVNIRLRYENALTQPISFGL